MNNEYVDITRTRHGSNPQSNAANVKVAPKKVRVRSQILEAMFFAGRTGLTLKDICAFLKKQPHQISGRITALKVLGLIEPTGNVFDGCAAYRLTEKGRMTEI